MRSNNNQITKATLTIELGNGDVHTFVAEPGEQGGNPRFMGQQLDTAVANLQARADNVIATYGDQIRPGRLPV